MAHPAREMDRLLAWLVEEGTLNGQFKCVLNLEDDSNPNFASEVVEIFLSDTRARLAKVRACLAPGAPRYADAQQLVLLMKGSNLTFGAERLTALCERLIQALERGDLQEATDTVQLQEEALAHLDKQLETFLGLDSARKRHASK